VRVTAHAAALGAVGEPPCFARQSGGGAANALADQSALALCGSADHTRIWTWARGAGFAWREHQRRHTGGERLPCGEEIYARAYGADGRAWTERCRRLYVRGTVMGFKRSKAHQITHTSLIQLENVNTKVRTGAPTANRVKPVLSLPSDSHASPRRPLGASAISGRSEPTCSTGP
jgi:hypothetical protein